MSTLPVFIKHINKFIRLHVDNSKPIILLLDNHSSRNSQAWLSECEQFSIIPIRLPANTTRFLQPCDQEINRRFTRTVRETRNELLKLAPIPTSNIVLKLKLAVAGHRAIDAECVRLSFRKCELWPMKFGFISKYDNRDPKDVNSVSMKRKLEEGAVSSRVPSVFERRSDKDTL